MKLRLTFLRLFAPLALLILLGAYLYVTSKTQASRSQVEASERLNVGLGAGVLDRRLLVLVRDLRLLAGDSLLHRFINSGRVTDRQGVEESFLNFSRAKEVYDQVRWIDQEGQEVVRVDLAGSKPKSIQGSGLQNKGDRYYFRDTMMLAPGVLYVSPLDLNVEQKQVELPPKPVLRIATPIANNQGEKRGIVVLNYLCSEMINYVREVTAEISDHLMVVNNDGYFLHAPDVTDEWGFMFDKFELTLANRYPASWKRLHAADQGQFQDENGLWTFATIYPLKTGTAHKSDAESGLRVDAPQQRWKVVAFLPPEKLRTLTSPASPELYVTVLLLLLLSAIGSHWLVRLYAREAEFETRFRIFFDRAMVGMAVVRADKHWQIVNPALCGILGYSAQELLERTWPDLTHPDDLPDSIEAYDRVLRGEANSYELEKRYLRADGAVVDVFIAAQAVRKKDGSVDYFLVIVEDITARLQAQRALQTSEERLRRLGDNLPESYIYQCIKRPNEPIEFIYVSSGVRLIHGVEPEDFLRDPTLLYRYIDPAQIEELEAAQLQSIDALSDFSMELHVRRASGEWGWLQVKSRPRRLVNGDIVWDGVASDITARRQVAALLDLQARRAEALLKLPQQSAVLSEREFMQYALAQVEQLTESKVSFMHLINPDQESIELTAWSSSTMEHCNTILNDHYPLSQAGLWADPARTGEVLVVNDYPNAANKQGLAEGHSPLQRFTSLPVHDSERVCMLAAVGNKATPYTDQDVKSLQLVANETWRIVRQGRAERALKIANQVVNASPVVCFRWHASADWPVVFVSDNVAGWGYSVDQVLAGTPPFRDMVHPDDLNRVTDEVVRYLAEERDAYDQEYRLLTADQRVLWVSDRTKVVRNVSGEVEFFDGVLTDISERKRQEQELAANLEAQRTLNKRLEEAHNQLLQSEKMASIGQLAAGVAHELNNPIGFVHSNLGTLESYLRDVMEIIDTYAQLCPQPDGEERSQGLAKLERLKEERDFAYIREDIGALLNESKDGLVRVRKIVQDLKSFSHVSEQEWQWADLHQGLDSTLNIVWNELKYKCKVVKEYGDLPKVHCLISQLNQVFMNLLVNAGHAIDNQGTITLRTSRLGEDRVCIEISDTGKGIAPEHLSRIFEPFFTTKPIGKGTGLGLSLSYGIVDKHHGKIEVASQVGIGTTFRIIVPINSQNAEGGGPGSTPMETTT